MNTRILDNQTSLSFQLTLFIQAGSNPERTYGTLNIILSPGETKPVSYGDLRNCFLSGLRITPLPCEPTDSYYCRVVERGDSVDTWLNDGGIIDLNNERLREMESTAPFAGLETTTGKMLKNR